ncbi:transporter [Streptomyces sp. JV178]|uniref:MMPL family transporter n=2 Tax=Streptomyces sp. JV178 TaxID=858632 RepID=UPI000C1B4E73|nr:MMPL family transporter [Streptomyces sp. JV178]PIM66861.1 transporter [Streptomyces sp. JV178]
MCEPFSQPDRSHIPGSLAALARWAVRRNRLVLAAAALFVVLTGLLSAGVSANLSSGGWLAENTPAAQVRNRLAQSPHGGMPPLLLLVRTTGSVDDPVARTAGTRLAEELRQVPGVTGVDSYWTGPLSPTTPAHTPPSPPDPMLRATDGHAALVALWLDATEHVRHDATERVLVHAARPHRPLEIQAVGEAVVTREFQLHSEQDLLRTELLAMPITLVLLLLIFGSVATAVLPLAVGAVAITGTTAILRALTTATPVSTFALSLTTAVGLALAVDYSLFLVARYREEIAGGCPHPEAVITAVRTAGRTVAASAGVVAVSLLGLLLFPVPLMRSLGMAGISVVLLAAAASLLIVPAALACLGERRAGRDFLARRRQTARSAARWHSLASAVMRRPLAVLMVTGALLVLLALPFRDVNLGLSDERVLPAGSPVVTAAEDLRAGFPQVDTEVDVFLPGWRPASPGDADRLDAYARRLSELPGVQGLRTATGTYLDGKSVGARCDPTAEPAVHHPCAGVRRFTLPTGTWLAINSAPRPYSAAAAHLLDTIRTQPAPAPALTGGATAELLDTRDVTFQWLPPALAVVVVATLALLFVFTRSLFLPLKALVINFLSLTATFGAMVYVFQQGHLRHLVGAFTVTGTTDLALPFIAFFLAFGLSMDYEILLLARVSEAYSRSRDTARATAEGLQAAAPLFTASAAVVLVVLLALAATDVTDMKIIAVTVALSVLLDAVVIRPLLVPAVIKLAGAANWWLPTPLRRRLPLPSAPEPLGHDTVETTASKPATDAPVVT